MEKQKKIKRSNDPSRDDKEYYDRKEFLNDLENLEIYEEDEENGI